MSSRSAAGYLRVAGKRVEFCVVLLPLRGRGCKSFTEADGAGEEVDYGDWFACVHPGSVQVTWPRETALRTVRLNTL